MERKSKLKKNGYVRCPECKEFMQYSILSDTYFYCYNCEQEYEETSDSQLVQVSGYMRLKRYKV